MISPTGCQGLSKRDKEELPKLRAQGMSLRQLARLTGVSHTAIAQELALPEAQASVKYWREVIKRAILQRSADGLVDGAFDMVEDAIASRDAKSFDAATRGIAALEKASASASGEQRKIELSGNIDSKGTLDVRALIGAVVEHIGGQSGRQEASQAVLVESVRAVRGEGQEGRPEAPEEAGA